MDARGCGLNLCSTKYETWFSLGCVSVGDWWNCCGAIAEVGWAKASFNCTGLWDKDVVLDKATAAVLAYISKLGSSSSDCNVYKLFQTFFY